MTTTDENFFFRETEKEKKRRNPSCQPVSLGTTDSKEQK
jgi:hypothetical protein